MGLQNCFDAEYAGASRSQKTQQWPRDVSSPDHLQKGHYLAWPLSPGSLDDCGVCPGVALQNTSMADIFTILLVFLLKS